jgi:hypothetical protein
MQCTRIRPCSVAERNNIELCKFIVFSFLTDSFIIHTDTFREMFGRSCYVPRDLLPRIMLSCTDIVPVCGWETFVV